MRPILLLWPLALLAASHAGAADDARIRCASGGCDFVLTGGASSDRSLRLQPNDGDPRGGWIKLNGFTEIFPEWRAPEARAMDRLFTWAPSATLVDGSSVRLFDVAPRFTIADTTGSAIFSVTGALTRTGSANPLYQWTAFFSGTSFRSAASAVCVGGAQQGSACTGDAGCPGGTCEGGSPLYQDAFYDASVAEQLRGHAIQKTWIPISFLSKSGLRASRTCGGGSNDDVPCNRDAQCDGGGTCRAAFLDQDMTFALFAQPGFHEASGATLIARDYAAVAVGNPNVSGAPEVQRFTGLLCDPYASDWANLPQDTDRYCIASLGPRIKSRHVGAFRIGDAREPESGLEVNGAITLDTGGAGTLSGSRAAGAALELNATTSPHAPGPLRVGAAARTVADANWSILLRDGPLELASPTARVALSEVTGEWTVATDARAGAQGFDGMRFATVIRGKDADGPRATGVYRQAAMTPTFVGSSSAQSAPALRVAGVHGTLLQPILSRPPGGAGGEVLLDESRGLLDAPQLDAGTRVADRRGVAFRDREGEGTQDVAIAVDVADQTVTTSAAALRSAMSQAPGKWHLALTGTADSLIGGSIAVGATTDDPPRARLDVRAQAPGSEVVRVGTGGADGPSLRMLQQMGETSGADPVTLHAFAPEIDGAYLVEARVTARCVPGPACTGESAAYVRRVLLRRSATTLKCVPSSSGGDFVAEEIDAWDAVLDCSERELRLRVRGDAERKVTWQDTLVIQATTS